MLARLVILKPQQVALSRLTFGRTLAELPGKSDRKPKKRVKERMRRMDDVIGEASD